MDKDLELILTEIFYVKPETARSVSSGLLTVGRFQCYYDILEHYLGYERSSYVVSSEAVLNHMINDFGEYIGLVKQIHKKDPSGSIPADQFLSIDSMKRYLSGNLLDPDKIIALPLKDYMLLHKDNPMSREYLDNLIEKGYIQIGPHEHWCRSKNKEDGRRGDSILVEIGHELNHMFARLGLDPANPKKAFGDHEISVDDKTRKYLREIRAQTYARQDAEYKSDCV